MYESVKCPKCNDIIDEQSIYCTNCGTHRPVSDDNFCLNPDCVQCRRKTLFDSKVKYCGLCGHATTKGKELEDML
jgi:RNA polymerase subunit RPABC4/transcription elongation factor Spt4